MKKIRLVTAAFGEDNKELEFNGPVSTQNYTIDFAYYNNTNTHSRINSMHSRLKGKIPKMMEWMDYPGYDYYIWVDSHFSLSDSFMEKILEFTDTEADLFLFAHDKRSSIKEEVNHVNMKIREGNKYLKMRYEGELINEQVAIYLEDESFIDNKLFSGGCFMYSKDLVSNKDFNLMTDWLLHNVIYSVQDQLSLPYLLQKHHVKYQVYPHRLMKNEFMTHDFGMFY